MKHRPILFLSLIIFSVVICSMLLKSETKNCSQAPQFNVPQRSIIATPILINGSSPTQNWTNCPWVNGSGTWGDPYIIQNLQIDANNVDCITITNSSQYFLIANCTLNSNNSQAITLMSVSNGTIVNNTCTSLNSTSSGTSPTTSVINCIYADSVYNTTFTGNNCTATGSDTITANSNSINASALSYGLYLLSCVNNTISENVFTGNGTGNGTSTYSAAATVYGYGYGYGLFLSFSVNNTISGNLLTGNGTGYATKPIAGTSSVYGYGYGYGLYLSASANNIIWNNIAIGNGAGSGVDTNGRCHGSGYGYGYGFYSISGSYNLIWDNVFIGNSSGYGSGNNGGIGGSTGYGSGNGVYLDSGFNNTLWLNNCTGIGQSSVLSGGLLVNEYSYGYGISISDSNDTLTENICLANAWTSGIGTVTTASYGLFLTSAFNITISTNICIGNMNSGIFLTSSNNNTITQNDCSLNSIGISLDINSNFSIVFQNTLFNNSVDPILDNGLNNSIYNNYYSTPYLSASPNHSYGGSITLSWTPLTPTTQCYLFRNNTTINSINGLNFIANITSGNYIDNESSYGTYYYVVFVNNTYGNSSISNCVNVIVSAPIAPTLNSILPNPNYNGSITLSWTNLGGGVNYYLFRNTSQITTVSGLNFIANLTTSFYTDNLSSVGTYYYAVVAGSQFGNSSVSSNVTVTISLPATPMMTPILPNPNYNGSIALSWTNLGGGVNYYLFRNTSQITTVSGLNFIANLTTSFYTDNLSSVGTYYYAVVAGSQFGNSSVSSNVTVTISLPATPMMTPILPNPNYNGSIALSWTNLGGGVNYYLFRNTSQITTVSGLNFIANLTTSFYTDNLSSVGTYYYAVVAGSQFGNSSVSSNVTVTISLPATPMMTPILPNPNYNGSIALSWTNLGGGVNYYLFRNTSQITTVSGLNFIANLTTSFYTDNLSSVGTYYYAVVAGSQFGNSSVSSNVTVTISLPATPMMTPILPNPNYNGSIALSWTNLGGGVNYYLFRNTSQITTVSGLNFIANLTTSFYTDNLSSVGTYYYAVVAGSQFGNSSVSCNVTVTVSVPLAPLMNIITPNPSYNGNVTVSWAISTDAFCYYLFREPTPITTSLGLIFIANLTVCSYDDNLTSVGTYYYAVVACSSLGNSSISNCMNVTIFSVASAPLNLTAIPGYQMILLMWNPPSMNGGIPILNYTVYKSTSSGNETFYVQLGNVTSFTDNLINYGTIYYYKISANNTAGESPLSVEVNVSSYTLPNTPINFTATPIIGKIILNWRPPDSNGGNPIQNYTIYRSTSSGNEILYFQLGNVTSFTDNLINYGTIYYYKISANNTAGEGQFSGEVSVSSYILPNAPLNLTATPVIGQITLTWSPPDSNGGNPIQNYTIYRSSSIEDEKFYVSLGNVTNFTDDNVIFGLIYYYKVSANNTGGESPLSNEINSTTLGYDPSPPLMSAIIPNPNTVGNVSITWSAVEGAVSYNVYRAPTAFSSLVGIEPIASVVNTFFIDTNLPNGTYYYAVTAVNASGASILSNFQSVIVIVILSSNINPPNQAASPIWEQAWFWSALGAIGTFLGVIITRKRYHGNPPTNPPTNPPSNPSPTPSINPSTNITKE